MRVDEGGMVLKGMWIISIEVKEMSFGLSVKVSVRTSIVAHVRFDSDAGTWTVEWNRHTPSTKIVK